MSHVTVTHVTKHNRGMTLVTGWSHFSQSHDTEKVLEQIISYSCNDLKLELRLQLRQRFEKLRDEIASGKA